MNNKNKIVSRFALDIAGLVGCWSLTNMIMGAKAPISASIALIGFLIGTSFLVASFLESKPKQRILSSEDLVKFGLDEDTEVVVISQEQYKSFVCN